MCYYESIFRHPRKYFWKVGLCVRIKNKSAIWSFEFFFSRPLFLLFDTFASHTFCTGFSLFIQIRFLNHLNYFFQSFTYWFRVEYFLCCYYVVHKGTFWYLHLFQVQKTYMELFCLPAYLIMPFCIWAQSCGISPFFYLLLFL